MDSRTVRVFLSYAEGDEASRDLLMREATKARLPVEFRYMPTKQPWVPHWKSSCRNRVLECDGAILLITRRTHQAEGVRVELEHIGESRLPAIAVHMESGKGTLPAQAQG
jgi:hypothetical protein